MSWWSGTGDPRRHHRRTARRTRSTATRLGAAAATLGVTVEALRAALPPPPRPGPW